MKINAVYVGQVAWAATMRQAVADACRYDNGVTNEGRMGIARAQFGKPFETTFTAEVRARSCG